MRIGLLLALALASTSIATVTQAQEIQTPEAQETQIPEAQETQIPEAQETQILNQQTSQKQLRRQSDSPPRRRSRPRRSPVSEIDRLISQANQAMRRERYEQAASLFRDILAQNPPNRHEFHVGLGAAMLYDSPRQLSMRSSRGDAIDQFKRALELKNDYRPALRGLVQAYELQGDAYTFIAPRLARGNTDEDLDQAIENYQEAKNYLDQITQLDQRSPRRRERRAHYVQFGRRSSESINSKLARAYMERGDHEKQKRDPSRDTIFENYRAAFESLGLSWRYSSQWIDSEDCPRLISRSHSPRTLANSSRGSRPRQIRRNERRQLLAGEIRNKLAIAYSEKGDRENSLDAYCQALRVKDTYAPAHLKLGQALWRQRKQETAIKHYKRAIQVSNNYVEAYLALGTAYDEQGNQSAAGETYVQLFKIAPNTPTLASRLSHAQLTNLAGHFRARLRSDPNNAHKHHYYLGYVLHWQGDYQGAIENYDKSISFRPNTGSGRIFDNHLRRQALRRRGLALSKFGKHRQAIESIEQAMGSSPKAVDYYYLGEVLVNQGQDLSGAIASYSRAIEIEEKDENLALVYNARGQVRVMLEDWQDARRDFINAINSDKNYAKPHNNLGQLYQLSGSFDQAIYAYNKALSISDHNYPDARENLADAENQLDHWLATQEYQCPTCKSCDWFWLPSKPDQNFLKRRSVVRIVSRSSGVGAGWVIKKEGKSLWIVTNRHVVSERGEIAVEFFSNKPDSNRDYLKLPASLKEVAGDDGPDLALLVVDNAPEDIKPLETTLDIPAENSRFLAIGHPDAIGNSWSFSRVSISSIQDNELQLGGDSLASGNSGGPVINEHNQVVGIVTTTAPSGNDENATGGFGFAIPISYLQDTLRSWGISVTSR